MSLIFTPGISNTIVDACSHLFHLSDQDFLTIMNTWFPIQPSWKLVHLATALCYNMNSALSRQLPTTALAQNDIKQATPCGTSGMTCAPPYPIDPYLLDVCDPISILQLFAHRYCSHNQVRSRMVEDAICAVGQAFAKLGRPDPRLQPSGKLDFRLSRQLLAYKKEDPPTTRVNQSPFPSLSKQLIYATLPIPQQ